MFVEEGALAMHGSVRTLEIRGVSQLSLEMVRNFSALSRLSILSTTPAGDLRRAFHLNTSKTLRVLELPLMYVTARRSYGLTPNILQPLLELKKLLCLDLADIRLTRLDLVLLGRGLQQLERLRIGGYCNAEFTPVLEASDPLSFPKLRALDCGPERGQLLLDLPNECHRQLTQLNFYGCASDVLVPFPFRNGTQNDAHPFSLYRIGMDERDEFELEMRRGCEELCAFVTKEPVAILGPAPATASVLEALHRLEALTSLRMGPLATWRQLRQILSSSSSSSSSSPAKRPLTALQHLTLVLTPSLVTLEPLSMLRELTNLTSLVLLPVQDGRLPVALTRLLPDSYRSACRPWFFNQCLPHLPGMLRFGVDASEFSQRTSWRSWHLSLTKSLPSLTELKVSGNLRSCDLHEFATLEHLRSLDLEWCSTLVTRWIANPSEFEQLLVCYGGFRTNSGVCRWRCYSHLPLPSIAIEGIARQYGTRLL